MVIIVNFSTKRKKSLDCVFVFAFVRFFRGGRGVSVLLACLSIYFLCSIVLLFLNFFDKNEAFVRIFCILSNLTSDLKSFNFSVFACLWFCFCLLFIDLSVIVSEIHVLSM